MFKQMLSNFHYWIGSKDLINGHDHLRKCHDPCTLFTVDNDGKALSFFSSKHDHVEMFKVGMARLITEMEESNG